MQMSKRKTLILTTALLLFAGHIFYKFGQTSQLNHAEIQRKLVDEVCGSMMIPGESPILTTYGESDPSEAKFGVKGSYFQSETMRGTLIELVSANLQARGFVKVDNRSLYRGKTRVRIDTPDSGQLGKVFSVEGFIEF